uniref:Uncharacterized protein n=1 Tax=viral metagenome TaxID=1070528 RepID=A0A6C0CSY0_9ZZZZ
MDSPLSIRIPPNVFQPSYCGGNMAPKAIVIEVSPIIHQLQLVSPRPKTKAEFSQN